MATNYPGSTSEEDALFEKATAILDEEQLNLEVCAVVDNTVQLWERGLFGREAGKFFDTFEEFEEWARNYDGAE
jgi:hypothetical protein